MNGDTPSPWKAEIVKQLARSSYLKMEEKKEKGNQCKLKKAMAIVTVLIVN